MHEITGVHNKNKITGVHNENDVTHKTGEINDKINDNNTIIKTTEAEASNGATHETNNDDDISIELEDHDDNHVAIDDLNIIEQINAAQLNTNPETGDDAWENERRNVAHHRYNLR